ncbi:branched-chain amino acid ABC transporter permease [Bradyrhizobium sp. TM239]|nr:branched-chain amino acid ABC transporter permease [Bradyrhizobium sp. TM239]
MDFINLAHGVQYMVGAYLVAVFSAYTESFAVGLVLALCLSLALGLLLEVSVFRHLYGADYLYQVLATFGVIVFVDHTLKFIFGAAPLSVAIPDILSGTVTIAPGMRYPVYRLVVIASGIAVALLCAWMVNRTRLGMLVRAGASNAPLVSALGVNIRLLFTVVFGLGAMLAGFAGALTAPILSVEPGIGANVLILAFVVIVIGGVGSIRGSFVAALLIGLTDTLGRSFAPLLLRAVFDPSTASQVGRALAPMLIYILMAAVLFFRPAGNLSTR